MAGKRQTVLSDPQALDAIVALIEQSLVTGGERPLVLGLCGAQGSGKSTIAAAIGQYFCGRGIATAVISLDDLYLTLNERAALAAQIHPLLRTRGVPGTHDVALGHAVFKSIDAGTATRLPRFDKAADDRAAADDKDVAPASTRLVIFEGWCVGARPQPAAALAAPVNELERIKDAEGIWRRYVNKALSGSYQALFARIDVLVLLAAPDFETVFDWRAQQEQKLRVQTNQGMTGEDFVCFVRHYERITRHILTEMPSRAALVVQLDADRRALGLVGKSG